MTRNLRPPVTLSERLHFWTPEVTPDDLGDYTGKWIFVTSLWGDVRCTRAEPLPRWRGMLPETASCVIPLFWQFVIPRRPLPLPARVTWQGKTFAVLAPFVPFNACFMTFSGHGLDVPQEPFPRPARDNVPFEALENHHEAEREQGEDE